MAKAQATDWKSRYESSVRAQNQREASWLETEGMLRRAIRRLAIAGRGRDPELDGYLNEIQRISQARRDRDLDCALDRMAQRVIKLVEGGNAPGGAGLAAQSADGGDTIESVMMTLVSRLSMLQGIGAAKIRARIVEHISRGEWHVAIEETIDAVERLLHTLDHEKNDLESFIVGLTQELGAITRSIEAESADTDSNRRDTEALNELVRDGVATIERDVSAAKDIDVVKTAIAANISQIRSGVDDYVSALQQRYAASSERNRELGERMKQMESETETLQRQLDDNRRQLLTDALTGVRSRLAYDQAIQEALDNWQQAGGTFAYAILDIDHFKHINDNFGHSAGDRALQLVARLIRENVREGDTVYRLGGEEFVLLLPGADCGVANGVVEQARAAIGGCRFHFKQQDVRLTLSAGITEARAGDDVESIYQRADKALYQAKETGRNRQIIAA